MSFPHSVGLKRKVNWSFLTLLCLGMLALGYYLSWWFQAGRLQVPWLWPVFAAALAYIAFQIVSHWLLFLLAETRSSHGVHPSKHFSVDVFVTTCGEDHGLARKCLAAACAMHGDKQVWLLDDAHDPLLRQMAAELGANYLTRADRKDAKAGNLNTALAQTNGEILVVFDVDHVPVPGFLEATLQHFDDPKVGFVQVMLTFRDGGENWVEQAAASSSLGFYNPTSAGMDTSGSVTMMGSNSLIRREALASIGNYRPGLAEDLATSFALHQQGWRSAYVALPLAPGLAPPDLSAWFTQQFKWARGVFEVLVVTFPKYWGRLTRGDRLAYSVRMTMYWLGPVIGFHLLATLAVLLMGNEQVLGHFATYLLHLAPLAFCNALIHGAALKKWLHPSLSTHGMWKAVVLVYATWPVYALAWVMALLRVPLGFRPTPKQATGTLNQWWLAPQLVATVLLIGLACYRFVWPVSGIGLVVQGFALSLALPHMLFFGLLSAQPEADLQAYPGGQGATQVE